MMEDVEERRMRQKRKKKSAEGCHYRRVFRRDEAVEFPVLKELELTA